MPISANNITEALKTTTNNIAPGPSGISYQLLAWAHATRP